MAELPAITSIRSLYREAVAKRSAAEEIQQLLAAHTHSDLGIVHAYRASAKALMANYSLNPMTKLDLLKQADQVFLKAIRLDPTNPEIRFLRFAIHTKMPAFLRKNDLLQQDKQVLLTRMALFESFDLDLTDVSDFIRFFQESGHFSPEELASLHPLISE